MMIAMDVRVDKKACIWRRMGAERVVNVVSISKIICRRQSILNDHFTYQCLIAKTHHPPLCLSGPDFRSRGEFRAEKVNREARAKDGGLAPHVSRPLSKMSWPGLARRPSGNGEFWDAVIFLRVPSFSSATGVIHLLDPIPFGREPKRRI